MSNRQLIKWEIQERGKAMQQLNIVPNISKGYLYWDKKTKEI